MVVPGKTGSKMTKQRSSTRRKGKKIRGGGSNTWNPRDQLNRTIEPNQKKKAEPNKFAQKKPPEARKSIVTHEETYTNPGRYGGTEPGPRYENKKIKKCRVQQKKRLDERKGTNEGRKAPKIAIKRYK